MQSQKKIIAILATFSILMLLANVVIVYLGVKVEKAVGRQPKIYRLMDEKDRLRVEMKMDRGVPMLVMYDEQGNNRILATQELLRVRDPESGFISLEFSHGRPMMTVMKDKLLYEIELDKLGELLKIEPVIARK
jgi:hypothetical protein